MKMLSIRIQKFIKVKKYFLKILFIHCDLQGDLRSKVKVPNESQIMTSYLKLIVNVCLSGTYHFEDISHSTVCLLSNLFNYHGPVQSKFNRLLRLTIP